MQINALPWRDPSGSQSVGATASLQATIAYALAAPGSGFRKELCLSVGRAMELEPQVAVKLADGVENFHDASLLLDDLPCMDDAMERRGRLTTHIVHGESRAILAALALINRAYVSCWSAASQRPTTAGRAARLVNRLMGEAGILDGQDRDLHFCLEMGAGEVLAIAALKTGSLLQLCLMLPAVVADAGFRELLYLGRLARYWGKAYQALDDFKDLQLAETSAGKTPFQDHDKNRPNLVHSMGASQALWVIVSLLEDASRQVDRLASLNPRWRFLEGFHRKFADQRDWLLFNLHPTS